MHLIGFRQHPARPDDTVVVGVVVGDTVRPLATRDSFWTDPRAALAAAPDVTGPVIPLDAVTPVPIVPPSARVICVGLNYRAHAAEGRFEVPDHPTLFGRWTASLSSGGVPAPVPDTEEGLDWEGEVAAYIGSRVVDADPEQGLAAVLGYSTFNDLTARRAQKMTTQWTLGKNADRSGPLGPLVTADEVGDLRDGLRVTTRVNGTIVQDASTADMVFDVGALVSQVSATMTLHPGDVIATGTPEGVGYVRTPPWLLHSGDEVRVEVQRLGILTTPIVGPEGRVGA